MIDPAYLAALQKAFLKLHGVSAVHRETVAVVEEFEGETVWEGDVEVFQVNHYNAHTGYAWAYDKGKGSEIVAVLELPPVTSPKTAVQAFVVSDTQKKSRN